MPPTYLNCGALDVMMCHSFDMAMRLSEAGVPVVVSILEGTDHEFLKIPEKVPGGVEEVARMIAWLHRHMPASGTTPA
jgi:acetyl esterase/lipase